MDNKIVEVMLVAHGLKLFYNSEKSLIRYFRAYKEDETVDVFFSMIW